MIGGPRTLARGAFFFGSALAGRRLRQRERRQRVDRCGRVVVDWLPEAATPRGVPLFHRRSDGHDLRKRRGARNISDASMRAARASTHTRTVDDTSF